MSVFGYLLSLPGYLVSVPVVEVVLGAIWLRSVDRAWAKSPTAHQPEDIAERTLGATVIMGQVSAVITGSSIILAGIGAFVALKSDQLRSPQSYLLSFHLFCAVAWAVFALGTATYTTGVLPVRTPRQNFVRDRGVALLCSMALFFCLASSVRFLLAVSTILLSGPEALHASAGPPTLFMQL
jgi:hypothetical protein